MKKTVSFIAAVFAIAFVALLAYDGILNKESDVQFFSMNTYVTAKLKGADSADCTEQVREIVEYLDKECLSRTSEDSAVYLLNKNAGGDLGANEKLRGYISVLLDVSEKSAGAFDFALGAVSDLWSFGSEPRVPDEAELAQALSHSGYKKISLENNYLTYADPAAVLDFGATGKGIALDEIKEILCQKRIKEASVSVGGSVLLIGDKEFTVGIRNPFGESASYIAKLHIPEGCVSTSGGYEQQFEANGRKYHHILDPKTGYPVDNELAGVTVISESGIMSDALSTACFVLGTEKGSALAEAYGCKAVFVTKDKKIYVGNDMADIIEITDNSYTLVIQ